MLLSSISSLSTINRVEFFFADPGLFGNSIASLAQEMTSTRVHVGRSADSRLIHVEALLMHPYLAFVFIVLCAV